MYMHTYMHNMYTCIQMYARHAMLYVHSHDIAYYGIAS